MFPAIREDRHEIDRQLKIYSRVVFLMTSIFLSQSLIMRKFLANKITDTFRKNTWDSWCFVYVGDVKISNWLSTLHVDVAVPAPHGSIMGAGYLALHKTYRKPCRGDPIGHAAKNRRNVISLCILKLGPKTQVRRVWCNSGCDIWKSTPPSGYESWPGCAENMNHLPTFDL